jgi:hypothetical protein
VETIAPATPVVTEQWTATKGQIVITTTPIKVANTTPNSTKITGYNHNIVFKKHNISPKVMETKFMKLFRLETLLLQLQNYLFFV